MSSQNVLCRPANLLVVPDESNVIGGSFSHRLIPFTVTCKSAHDVLYLRVNISCRIKHVVYRDSLRVNAKYINQVILGHDIHAATVTDNKPAIRVFIYDSFQCGFVIPLKLVLNDIPVTGNEICNLFLVFLFNKFFKTLINASP